MNTIEELKSIRDGAPEGATHVDDDSKYYMEDRYGNQWCVFKGCWNVCVGLNTMRMPNSIRSLSDIETIIRLQAENVELLEIVSEFVSLVEKAELEALTPATSLKKPLSKGESK